MSRDKLIFSAWIFLTGVGFFLFACGGGGGVDKNKDTDGDGMPDWWEIQNGLNPLIPSDANLDPDKDGYTNLEEYQNGTNPQVPDPPKELCNGLDDDGNGFIDEIWMDKGKGCGKCGTYQCSADGLSLECQGEGVCTPGANKICGTNGMKTCLATCAWNDCIETPQCPMTGQVKSATCGYCGEGTQRATCLSNGTWGEWGTCENLGCQPGADKTCLVGGKGGTKTCGDDCQLGDCTAGCTPGTRISEVCGECGGTRARVCLTGGFWGPPGDCLCAENSMSMDVPGYGTQTRTCGIETGCNWSSWGYCGGGECSFGDVETETCGCGGHGQRSRTCGDDCAWGEWSECSGDYDEVPPSPPVPGNPRDGESVTDFPVALTWTASSDACGLSTDYAYELNVVKTSVIFPSAVTLETNSTSYSLDLISQGSWLWRVRAKDSLGNYSAWSKSQVFGYAPKIVFSEDFEGGSTQQHLATGDDNPGSGLDYWGVVINVRSWEGFGSAWCAAIGEESTGDCGYPSGISNSINRIYDNSMQAYLRWSFDLNIFTHAWFRWWYWLEVADANDCLKLEAREVQGNAPGTWTDEWEDCAGTSGWKSESVDLDAYAGKPNITIQFLFSSDGSGHCAEGAYLDDIVVEGW